MTRLYSRVAPSPGGWSDAASWTRALGGVFSLPFAAGSVQESQGDLSTPVSRMAQPRAWARVSSKAPKPDLWVGGLGLGGGGW